MPIQSPGTTASSSTGFSHKFRGFTHLSKNKTKTTGTEQPEEEIGGKEFEIVNTPDRPTRVISTAEVPTEEECGELILRWHLAAKRREVCLPPLTWSGGGGDRRVQMDTPSNSAARHNPLSSGKQKSGSRGQREQRTQRIPRAEPRRSEIFKPRPWKHDDPYPEPVVVNGPYRRHRVLVDSSSAPRAVGSQGRAGLDIPDISSSYFRAPQPTQAADQSLSSGHTMAAAPGGGQDTRVQDTKSQPRRQDRDSANAHPKPPLRLSERPFLDTTLPPGTHRRPAHGLVRRPSVSNLKAQVQAQGREEQHLNGSKTSTSPAHNTPPALITPVTPITKITRRHSPAPRHVKTNSLSPLAHTRTILPSPLGMYDSAHPRHERQAEKPLPVIPPTAPLRSPRRLNQTHTRSQTQTQTQTTTPLTPPPRSPARLTPISPAAVVISERHHQLYTPTTSPVAAGTGPKKGEELPQQDISILTPPPRIHPTAAASLLTTTTKAPATGTRNSSPPSTSTSSTTSTATTPNSPPTPTPTRKAKPRPRPRSATHRLSVDDYSRFLAWKTPEERAQFERVWERRDKEKRRTQKGGYASGCGNGGYEDDGDVFMDILRHYEEGGEDSLEGGWI